ncbi:MAG: flagellar assembly protein FliW [bacterium]|nr:flagellar assembly protein FliW [bacterium]
MREFDSPRFGLIEVENDKLIVFEKGLPGFPDSTEFIVMDHDKETPLKWLHCVNHPEVAFLIVNPTQVLAGYEFDVPREVLEAVGFDKGTDNPLDLVVFVIMNVDETELTANLRAPVIVHMKTRRAHQIILNNPELPLRHPIEATAPEAE